MSTPDETRQQFYQEMREYFQPCPEDDHLGGIRAFDKAVLEKLAANFGRLALGDTSFQVLPTIEEVSGCLSGEQVDAIRRARLADD